MLLGDLGATVIKVEEPGRGDDTRAWGPPYVDGESTYYTSINRNKRSVALDLRTTEDAANARTLAARADVVIENFRSGRLAQFALGHDAWHATIRASSTARSRGSGQMRLRPWPATTSSPRRSAA